MDDLKKQIQNLKDKKFVAINWSLFVQVYYRERIGSKPKEYYHSNTYNLEKDSILILSSIEQLQTEGEPFIRILLHPSQHDDDNLTYFDLDFMVEIIEPAKNISVLRPLDEKDLRELLLAFKGIYKNFEQVAL